MSGSKDLPEDIVARLLENMRLDDAPLPSGRLKARIMASVAQAATAEAGVTTVRAETGEWREMGPGVEYRVLHDHGRVQTWLVRGVPGARLPGHEHLDFEEVFVLEGNLEVDGTLLCRGDYQISRPGSRHGPHFSPAGCVLLIRSPSPAMQSFA